MPVLRSPIPPEPAAVDRSFGHVLRELRLEVGLSQEALGLQSGSGRTFVSQLERGERGASLKTVFRLAHVLGASPAEVIAQVEALLGAEISPRGGRRNTGEPSPATRAGGRGRRK